VVNSVIQKECYSSLDPKIGPFVTMGYYSFILGFFIGKFTEVRMFCLSNHEY
jgi:hypothetical protein